MKLFVLCCGVWLTLSLADQKPIYEFAEWWKVRDFEPSSTWMEARTRGGKIIGGREATEHQFPYHVGLLLFIKDTNEVGLCSGAMLSPTRVVSVAHCVDIVVGIQAVFGAHFINRAESSQVKRSVSLSGLVWHENYNPRNLTNDVAIINLPAPVTMNNVIQAVKLPEGDELVSDFNGKVSVVSGWGRFLSAQVLSKALRYVELKVISNEICRKRFPSMIHNTTSEINSLFSLNLLSFIY